MSALCLGARADAVRTMTGLVALALVCASACKTDRITTTDPSVTAVAEVWSGGGLMLSSPSFTGADSTPIVMAGAETLAVRRAGPDSVSLQMPDTDGLVTLAVGLRDGGRTLLQVRVHGVTASGVGPALTERYGYEPQLYPWPGSATSTALALDHGRLVLVDLADNTISVALAPDTGLGCDRNFLPVPSVTTPGLITVAQLRFPAGPCELLAVPMAPSAALPDTGPSYGGYPAIHLARGKWLVGGHKGAGLVIYTGSPAGGFTATPPILTDPGFGFRISPRGDRVVPTEYYWAPGGVPVFDVGSSGVAFSLGLQTTWGAAFTSGGDTLFVTGQDSAQGNVLLSLDAASGVLFGRVLLQGTGYSAVADPARPWVYVASLDATGPYVDVFDRSSLTRVTTLRASASALRGFDLNYDWELLWPTLVLNAVTRRLYLVFMSVPTYVFQFDLMP